VKITYQYTVYYYFLGTLNYYYLPCLCFFRDGLCSDSLTFLSEYIQHCRPGGASSEPLRMGYVSRDLFVRCEYSFETRAENLLFYGEPCASKTDTGMLPTTLVPYLLCNYDLIRKRWIKMRNSTPSP
jgi:hypothetical protein